MTKTKQKSLFWALLCCLLLAAVMLSACGKKPAEPETPVQPPETKTVAEQLTEQDFAKMAEAKTEFIGDHVATGKVLSLSLLAPYNKNGMELKTTEQPYQIIVEYDIPEKESAQYSDTDIEMMATMTAFNCFILIDNVDEVSLQVDYTGADGSAKQFKKLWQRKDFEDMCEVDVRNMANDPNLWSTAVSAYVKEATAQ